MGMHGCSNKYHWHKVVYLESAIHLHTFMYQHSLYARTPMDSGIARYISVLLLKIRNAKQTQIWVHKAI